MGQAERGRVRPHQPPDRRTHARQGAAYAPTKIEYAIDRFAMEIKRELDVLDRRLAESEFIAGPDHTIADIAIFP